ncbi:MAG: transcription-repair coupling factor [Gammaproteobacteria bacterium]|nr:transcription-repair coupling factor [Gammaproteobacteria bacterium]
MPPNRLWLSAEEIFVALKKCVRYKILAPEHSKKTLPMLDNGTLNILNQAHLKNYRILIAAESAGRKDLIKTQLNKQGKQTHDIATWADFLSSHNNLCVTIAPIWMGVELEKNQLAIISEYELTHKKIQQRKKNQPDNARTPQLIYHSVAELNIGDPVVHIEHGIGRYLGLQVLTIGQMTNEFVALEYQHGNKLFIPVSNLHLISRYSAGNIEQAPLHTLGSDQWGKARKKAMEKAHDAAAELLSIYAKRELSSTEPMFMDNANYEQFCQGFPFEETPDQAEAIRAVLQDLQSKRPMDRVICGDVGFGKTEVAMRAAFIAVMNHQQVAILVPTTLLAEQHGENFNNRFSAWPVKVAVLCRFKTEKEQKTIIDELKTGKIDIVIGTHKLLQEDVRFHGIGLLIIDEEHRFGVRQKEKFKKLKAKVNILTMTATPIPRTLNMAMSKLRDFSMIATPPAKRLSIKTFLHERQTTIITEAIERELHRGGQVFFLHNNVATIEQCAEELKRLLPQTSIRLAHGQMSERELETIMADFYHQRFSVLVCTTIIETGIDIPTANTIIMDRADKLGLAQLHQLRGRVGRSHHQAYAYLLYPSTENLGADAQKRLDAIASLGDLGAGFQLASHDLEIRGAGELLGEEQSGQIQEVGFSLYLELVEKAIHTLKNGGKPLDTLNFGKEYDVDIGLPALIPENFMPDVHARLAFYQRFSDAKSKSDLEQLHVEIIDRFGLLPPTLKNLISTHEIKLDCQRLGIKKLSANKHFIKVEFSLSTPINPMTLITLVQSKPNLYQLPNPHSFKANMDEHADEQRVEKIYALLKMIKN